MTRVRYVKGKTVKTTSGQHQMYAQDSIVFNSDKYISETGQSNGVNYGEPKDPYNENGYLFKLTPYYILSKNNVLISLEIIRGDIFENNCQISMGARLLEDYWVASPKKIYFIPEEGLCIDEILVNGEKYNHIPRNKNDTPTVQQITKSLELQLRNLHQAAEARKKQGGKSLEYRIDQILTEGYYRFEKCIIDLENIAKTETDIKYIQNWINKINL